MNIKGLRDAVDYCLEARITPWIWGVHGVGKSETIAQYCKDKEYLLFDFRLNTQSDIGDILGLADFVVDSKTGQKTATKFCKPDWLDKCFTFCEANPNKKAIVFFDEINRAARRDMVGPIFQMSIDHRLHTYDFPNNLHLIVASNPDTNDYGVLNLDDKALLDRFCHINLEPSKDEWFNYARDSHNGLLVDFLQEQPELIEQSDLEKFSLRDIVYPSRRSWTAVNKILELNPPKPVLRDLIMGLVGFEASVAFMKFLDSDDKPLTVDQVLKSYNKYQERIKKYSNSKTGGRLDILKVTCDNLVAHFKENKEKKITKKQAENLVDFLIDIPNDILFNVMRPIYLIKPCREVIDASTKNEDLMKKIKIARGKEVEND